MLEISGISLSLDAMLPQKHQLQRKEIARALKVSESAIKTCQVVRRSVDARKKSKVHFATTCTCELDTALEKRLLKQAPKGLQVREAKSYQPLEYADLSGKLSDEGRSIVVVGMGPAGLFAALYLARCGLKPLVIERGLDVQRRAKEVAAFEKTGVLNPNSNIQFGEGGAGTFSDGKLTTNIKSPYAAHVLHWFVEAGAPESILMEAHPHLGSDNLPGIVAAMRNELIESGCEVRFGTRLVGWHFEGSCVASLVLEEVETGRTYEVVAQKVVLACGHSARDVFELCKKSEFALEQKPFSVGVRIEHSQEVINASQWGSAASHPALHSAEYKLAVHLPNGRSVYTFCMCPGGEVVAAASEEGGVVTNGMSVFARDGKNANAALLVNVDPSDFGSDDVLSGVEFQRKIEQAAFDMAKRYGAKPYQAPCQSVGDFLHHSSQETCEDGDSTYCVQPTYGRGVFRAPLSECLPTFVIESLKQALPLLGRRLAHFDDDRALMTAPETRSSSPVRICRGKNMQAYVGVSCFGGTQNNEDKQPDHGTGNTRECADDPQSGVFPCGEGPGFAGGIMSAACDGLRVARAVVDSLT